MRRGESGRGPGPRSAASQADAWYIFSEHDGEESDGMTTDGQALLVVEDGQFDVKIDTDPHARTKGPWRATATWYGRQGP